MSANKITKNDVAEIINNFINGCGGEWDWDDFISIPIKDKYLDSIRQRCAGLPEEFPAGRNKGCCNSDGVELLKQIVFDLRNKE